MISNKCTTVIYSYGMLADFYVWIVCHKGELERIGNFTDRTHSILDTHELQVAMAK